MFPDGYKALSRNSWKSGDFELIPIRFEDRASIRKWRNEQLYHLRQAEPLTEEDQDNYFRTVVATLFEQENPTQLLFSYLQKGVCIGYGGLVHINRTDQHAEISFIMDTSLEKEQFHFHWGTYLDLIERVAFDELKLHKVFLYAYDLRPHLFEAVEQKGYTKEATLKEHCRFEGNYIDVIIHSKLNKTDGLTLRKATATDAALLFDWTNEESVRANSFSQDPVAWDDHVNWLDGRMNDPDTQFFIAEAGAVPAGQIRLDEKDGFFVINYSIDREFRGRGYGKKIVAAALRLHPEQPFKALVKRDNPASVSIFESLGFRLEPVENSDILTFVKDEHSNR